MNVLYLWKDHQDKDYNWSKSIIESLEYCEKMYLDTERIIILNYK